MDVLLFVRDVDYWGYQIIRTFRERRETVIPSKIKM